MTQQGSERTALDDDFQRDDLDLRTRKEAALALKVKPKTISNYIAKGWIRAVYFGRNVRISKSELLRVLSSGVVREEVTTTAPQD